MYVVIFGGFGDNILNSLEAVYLGDDVQDDHCIMNNYIVIEI